MSNDKLRCPSCGATAQWDEPDDDTLGSLYCPNGCYELRSRSHRDAMRRWSESCAKKQKKEGKYAY